MKYIYLLCTIIWVIHFVRFLLGHTPGDFVIGTAFVMSSFFFLQIYTLHSIKEVKLND